MLKNKSKEVSVIMVENSVFICFYVVRDLQKNWNLFCVNVAMCTTGVYQLSRKIQ